MVWRDMRSAEVRLLAIAVAVAVSATSAVGFLADRFGNSLKVEAARAMGGQLILHSDREIGNALAELADRIGVRHATTVNFPSMVTSAAGGAASDANTLVSVKAVDERYPLLGKVLLQGDSTSADHAVRLGAGDAWVERQVTSSLKLQIGESIRLGDRSFRIADILISEPDRGLALVNIAPRVMIRRDELASTHLDQPGARLSYRLLVAGSDTKISEIHRALEPLLARGQRIETANGSDERERPEMFQTLDRARSFLMLASLQAGLVSALAIALAARRFTNRRLDACALMRTMGATQSSITRIYLVEFLVVGVAASGAGVIIGFAVHEILLVLLSGLVDTVLPPASWKPALQGMLFGVVLLMAFAFAPIAKLRRSSPVSVLRRAQASTASSFSAWDLLGPLCVLLLLIAQGNDVRLTTYAIAGYLAAAALMALIALAVMRASHWTSRQRTMRSVPLRLAIAGLTRRPGASVAHVLAIALGLSTLLILQLLSNELVATWQEVLGPDAPNRFILNIQPDQRERFVGIVKAAGLATPETLPMVRGRLISINGAAVNGEQFKGRARRMVEREFNLSYMANPPAHNTIVSGSWWKPGEKSVSVEQGLAEQLHLKLGDRLAFEVAGQTIEAPISNLRKVQWTSMQINFFVIFTPSMLADAEQSFISTLHVPPEAKLEGPLISAMNNLTIVDTGTAVSQLQSVLNQLVRVVRILSLLAIAAGLLVLAVISANARDERLHEVALLRAFGASRFTLSAALWMETAVLGALAGVLAAMTASTLANVLGEMLFDLPWTWHPVTFAAATIFGILLSWLGGWWGTRHVARQSPLLSLREA